jgi:acetyltransferase-like isoleucine patch superfamily enzyme
LKYFIINWYEKLSRKASTFISIFRGYLFKFSIAECFGPVSIGSDLKIIGRGYIYCQGSFSIKNRNRIEAYEKHRGETYSPVILFGDNVSMEDDCHIASVNRVELHSNVLLASKVYISDHSHGDSSLESLKLPPYMRRVQSKGPVIIEENVWIGEGAAILPGVRVGKNSIVGANSVVTRDVPPNSIVGGAPARVLRVR